MLFGTILINISSLRDSHTYLIWGLAPFGILMTYLYKNFGGNSHKGMSLIFAVGHNENEKIPKRLIGFVTIFTWLTHLFGGSAGREGVAVQIGASISYHLSKSFHSEYNKNCLLMAGMAAGFGGLFQVPIAATFFALEVLHRGRIRVDAILPVSIAALTSSVTSHLLGLEKFSVKIFTLPSLSYILVLKLIIAGIAFGICGLAFTYSIKAFKYSFQKLIKNSYTRIAIVGTILSIVIYFLYSSRYAGLGTNIIADIFNNNAYTFIDFIAKLLLTAITLSVGYQGGEVTPIFAIGASLGALLSSVLSLPLGFLAALGYASVFSSSTKTLIAPIFIATEVFGYNILPYICITVIISYSITGKLSGIYSQRFDTFDI